MGLVPQRKENKVALDLSRASVLVVDSDQYAVEMINQVMRGFGLREQSAVESAALAQVFLEKNKVDLVIVEAVLPDMLGANLIKWMRRHFDEVVRHLPIIVLTGHTIIENVQSARDSGANMIVKKPVSVSILFDRLAWSASSDRLFVDTDSYAGPDRRFRSLGPPDGVGRRSTDLSAEIGNAAEPNLLQSEIDSFIKPVKMSID
jgi:response regulator RpfG family c-di-GMP phosphodiesterase